MKDFFKSYFLDYNRTLAEFIKERRNHSALEKAIRLIKMTGKKHSVIYLIGNGGSSAIAEHMAIDFTKNAGLRALAISGSPMLTTFANDYGYERIFEKAIEKFSKGNDVLIAISSGGKSPNILNACKKAKELKMKVITFSGFNKDNPLRKIGDINLWVNSRSFGYVELIHNLLIHYINDAIIGTSEYMIR